MFVLHTVVNENVSLVISRQILTDFSAQLEVLSDPDAKTVAHFTLEKIHTRVISFEEQVNYTTVSLLDKFSHSFNLFPAKPFNMLVLFSSKSSLKDKLKRLEMFIRRTQLCFRMYQKLEFTQEVSI